MNLEKHYVRFHLFLEVVYVGYSDHHRSAGVPVEAHELFQFDPVKQLDQLSQHVLYAIEHSLASFGSTIDIVMYRDAR